MSSEFRICILEYIFQNIIYDIYVVGMVFMQYIMQMKQILYVLL